MPRKSAEWPEVGDFVISTVTQIVPYGAYVTLDEYNIAGGLLHISELSSRWVKNIRDHVREGQKVVLKVMRVDAKRGHVDLSLRRVTARERSAKLLEWKRERKSMAILRAASEKMSANLDEAYKNVGSKIEAHYGSMHLGFEEAHEKGEEALLEAGVPKTWAKVLSEMAREKIRVPKVKVRGVLSISCRKPDGAERIRRVFKKTASVERPEGTSVKTYVLGAPRYRIEVSSKNYRDAERVLETAVQTALKGIKATGGEGSFKREV